jgi:hypothetical protein
VQHVARVTTVDACVRALYGERIRWQGFRANVEGSNMRYLMIAIVMAAGASLAGTAVSAAPANGKAIAQAADHASYVTDVAGGCGRGWHRDAWGHCVP